MIVLRFLFSLILFQIPALLAGGLAARVAKSSREEWQLLAWVPVMPLVIWGSFIAIATTRDPTSHNLWPFELVIWIMLSGILFGAVLLGRWLASRHERRSR